MTVQRTKPRPRLAKPVGKIPDESGAYPLGGFTFAGGSVLLGSRIDTLLAEIPGGLPRNRELIVGSLVLASCGLTDGEIASRFETDQVKVATAMIPIRRAAHAPQRQMLPHGALANDLLRIEKHGSVGDFRVEPERLVLLGLLARGVGRARLAEANDISVEALTARVQSLYAREGFKKTVGCVTAALVTGQLDEVTCAPMVPSEAPGEEMVPYVPVDAWEDLVHTKRRDAFVEMYQDLYRQAA